jgi:hypothetical protein
MNVIFNCTGNYGRSVVVWKEEDECLLCKEKKKCLNFDSSDDEYSTITFCYECLKIWMKDENI